MKKKFKTTPTSDLIPKSGYVAKLQDVQVMDTSEVVEEAIGRGYVTESPHVVEKVMTGVLSSMIDGCGRDGNARRIDGYLQLMPYMTGLLQKKTSDYDPAKNKIIVRARLLKEMTVNSSNWSLSNTTEGRELAVFDIAAVGSDDLGKVRVGASAVINGRYTMLGKPDEGVWADVLDSRGKAVETSLGACTVSASDVHSVTFSLPAGCAAHVGRKLRFTVKGYAGVEEGELQEAQIDAELLEAVTPPAPPPEPIAESSDGVVKVYAVEDDAGASTPAGLLSAHGTLFVKGTGLTLQESLTAPGIKRDVECDLDESHAMRPGISIEQTADGLSVAFGSESGTMKNGEYPDAKLVLRYYKTGEESDPELIEIPVGIKVTMGQEDWPE